MSVRTVKVSNVSFKASERDLKEFFSFSGDIQYVEMKSENEASQMAYVTFKEPQGAETAVLLTGATIGDKTVTITLDPDYQLPPAALAQLAEQTRNQGGSQSALQKAEDVVTSILAKGFIFGKDAVDKAKSFDEKHQLTSTASSKISSFDQKIGLTEKVSMGTTAVNSKVKEMDERYQVSEKTKTAYAVAGEKASNAGSAIMKNRYVQTGATWVSDAYNRVAKAAGEVGQRTREKVRMAEEEKKRKMVDDFAKVHLSDSDSPKGASPMAASPKEASPKAASPKVASPKAASPKASASEKQQPSKPEPAHGLIL